jgi:hypothetical protein
MDVDMLLVLEFVSRNKNNTTQTIYDAVMSPSISIREYACRIYKYIIGDTETLAYTMYYLALYIDNTKTEANITNIHRLFIAAATVSHKFWNDHCYHNKYIAKVAGIKTRELNALECDFLKGIEWELYKLETKITDNEFVQIANRISGVEYSVIEAEHGKQMEKK